MRTSEDERAAVLRFLQLEIDAVSGPGALARTTEAKMAKAILEDTKRAIERGEHTRPLR